MVSMGVGPVQLFVGPARAYRLIVHVVARYSNTIAYLDPQARVLDQRLLVTVKKKKSI